MNNKKIIIISIISTLGLILLTYGVVNYINSNKNLKTEEVEQKDNSDQGIVNRELEGLGKNLLISDFKYENKEGKCEFSFILTNNDDKDIQNELLKVNFYDINKNLLNTFEYNIDYLGIYDRVEVENSVNVNNEPVLFEYEFDNKTLAINEL